MTFELPGLEKGPISYWFLKGWEPSARTATFDDEKTTFAEDLTGIMKIILDFLRNPSLEVQERVPIFARRKMTVPSRVGADITSPLFAKMRRWRNYCR